mgnify:CR=1 FL=1
MKGADDMSRYDDIIGMRHHISDVHPQMSLSDRAAQFSPFAALSGFEEAIDETARTKEQKTESEKYDIQ